MRIVFIVLGNSRRSNYLNGETIRSGGGGASGTDTSNILVAEYLANEGHEIVYCSEKLEPPIEDKLRKEGINPPSGEEINKVKYTDFQLTGIENKTFDIMVSNLWYQDYENFPGKVTKGLIYWSHMQWIYGLSEIKEYVKKYNLKLGIVNISLWEKEMNFDTVNHLIREANAITTTIPNPIADDILTQVKNMNLPKKPGKFVFHAAWARGGNVAVDAVRKLNISNKEFHAFDYLMATHDHSDSFFNLHNGVDKITLFKHLAEAEYFFYPLYTPYKDVHKDTFSCVIAEAIALGTVPITYPLGALPENFSGYCSWVDTPQGANLKQMNQESLSKDLDGIFNNSELLVKKYNELESTGNLKKYVKENGFDYIINNFKVENIGKLWVDFLNRL
jgi:glycosyltransferase involved in cell wall biosynthesis